MAGWQVVQMSLAQSAGLARVAETAGEGWLFGRQPLDDDMLEQHDVAALYDEGLLHVLTLPVRGCRSTEREPRSAGNRPRARRS